MFKNTVRLICGILVFHMLLLTTGPRAQAAPGGVILYVDDDAPPGGDGLSWVTAYKHLQDPMRFAANQPFAVAEIRVAQGTYRPDRTELNPEGTGDRLLSFVLSPFTSLLGGFAGVGAPDPDLRDITTYETILSGDLAGDDVPGFVNMGENSYTVLFGEIFANIAILIEGFTITGGNGVSDNPLVRRSGGGLHLKNGSCNLNACIFRGNRADQGGGIFLSGGSFSLVVAINDCRIMQNQALYDGGGMFIIDKIVELTGLTFSQNSSLDRGGALFVNSRDFRSVNCQFIDNSAVNTGGSVFIDPDTTPILFENCAFENNSAERGGGLFVEPSAFPLTNNIVMVSGSSFSSNQAVLGGAIYESPTVKAMMTDNLYQLNTAQLGGSLYGISSSHDESGSTYLANTAIIGGGVNVKRGTIQFAECQFAMNVALLDGGGVFDDESESQYINCLFESNEAGQGGGMYVQLGSPSIVNSEFLQNHADRGGGFFARTAAPNMEGCSWNQNEANILGGGLGLESGTVANIANCTFANNAILSPDLDAFQGGGGIHNKESTVMMNACVFASNTSTSNGGAIMNSAMSTMTIQSCVFRGNVADFNGGAIMSLWSNLDVQNSLLAGNVVQRFRGGGMFLGGGTQSTVTNCTFVDNHSFFPASALEVQSLFMNTSAFVSNSIFWNNTVILINTQDKQIRGANRVDNSCIELGWGGSGSNNISFDPRFIDPDGPDNDPATLADNDYRLSSGSPCIDAGDNSLIPPDDFDLDQDGNMLESLPHDLDAGPRVRNAAVDMGAYESNYCTADFSGDGQVNVTDLLSLLGAWGMCQSPCSVDTNGDGQVNVTDLLVLLAGWGACP